MTWFSASARYAISVEGIGLSRVQRSVWTFDVADTGDYQQLWDDAFQRALTLARTVSGKPYNNAAGSRTAWKLIEIEIETLDMLGDAIPDGREVYSEFYEQPAKRDKRWTVDTVFRPEESKPGPTGV